MAMQSRPEDGRRDPAQPRAFDSTVEDTYWRSNYSTRSYVRPGAPYDTYRDAYRYGWEARNGSNGDWAAVSGTLEQGWLEGRGRCRLDWADAHGAVRDGWSRVGASSDQDEN